MNKQTQEKISKIKKCIENKEDLKEIEKKFFNTKAKKQDFLDRTYTYFDPLDLDYLNYIHKVYGKISEFKPLKEKEVIESVEEKQDLDSKEKEIAVEVAEVIESKPSLTNGNEEITDSDSTITNSKQEITESNSVNTVSNQLLANYFNSKENVEILISLIEEHKKKSYKILDNEEIEIPSEVLKLKNTGGINVKSNAEQYQVIKDMAQKNNVPIATFMNYVIWYFIKSHS